MMQVRWEHGRRVLRIRGKGGKTVLVPLPPAVARAIERATEGRDDRPILRITAGRRMDRHAASRRLVHLSEIGRPPKVVRSHATDRLSSKVSRGRKVAG